MPEHCCAIDTESLNLGTGESRSHVRADVAHIPVPGGGGRNQFAAGRDEGIARVRKRRAARPVSLVSANSTPRAVVADDRAWVSEALCRATDPDDLFVRGANQRKAAVICRHCPVMQECGAEALDNKVEFGVWGGMTERQRRALLKQHPEIVSWTNFFAARNAGSTR